MDANTENVSSSSMESDEQIDIKSKFLTAAQIGDVDSMQQLIPDERLNVGDQSQSIWMSALILAVKNDHIGCLKCLMENKQKGKIDGCDSELGTVVLLSLSLSTCNDQVACLKYLLTAAITIGMQMPNVDSEKIASTLLNVMNGSIYEIESLLSIKNPDISIISQYRKTAELITSLRSPVKKEKKLGPLKLKVRVNIEGVSKYSMLALVAAILEIHTECVLCLMDPGFNEFHRCDHYRETAVTLAVINGHVDCVSRLLQESMADNKTYDSEKRIPFLVAAIYDQTCCIKWLVDRRSLYLADIDNDDKDKVMDTSLMIAATFGYSKFIGCLLQLEDIDVNVRDLEEHTPLMLASMYGHFECLKLLINTKKIFIYDTDESGNTVLMLASMYGHTECVKYLLDLKTVNVQWRGRFGCSALMLAAKNGHTDCLKILSVTKGTDINMQDTYGMSACMLAASNGHIECVRSLLETDQVNLNIKDENGFTALMHAAGRNHIECLKLLSVAKGCDINAQNVYGMSACMLAASNGHSECLQYLLDTNKVSLNIQDKFGNTALMLTAINDHTQCFKILMEKEGIQFDVQDKNGNTILMLAAMDGLNKYVKILVEKKGMKINTQNQNGNTALLLAAVEGHYECIKYLIERGGTKTCHIQSTKGRTALILAAGKGHTECVKFLVSIKGININARDEDGNTAVLLAARNGHAECMTYLLNLADVDYKTPDNKGKTVFMFAARHGFVDCVRELAEKVNVNEEDIFGDTALTIATTFNHSECVKYLCDIEGIDINKQDQVRHTALMIAAMKDFLECVEYLIKSPMVDLNVSNIHGHTALMLAGRQGHFNCIEVLVGAKGIDINKQSMDKNTALTQAIKYNHVKSVGYILGNDQMQVDVLKLVEGGETALTLCVKIDNSECLLQLLDYVRANLSGNNKLEKEVKTALVISFMQNQSQCGNCLLAYCIDDLKTWSGTAFVLAFSLSFNENVYTEYLMPLIFLPETNRNQEKRKIMETALKSGASFNSKLNKMICAIQELSGERNCYLNVFNFIRNAFHSARNPMDYRHVQYVKLTLMKLVMNIHIECIQCQIDTSKIINELDSDKYIEKLLIFAIMNGHVDCVERLLENFKSTRSGVIHMVFEIIAICGNTECVRQFRQFSGFESVRAEAINKAQMIACIMGHNNFLRWTLSTQRRDAALQNLHDSNEKTSLMLAAMNGHNECVMSLLDDLSVSVNGRDENGYTALMLAIQEGQIECVRCLTGNGRIDVQKCNTKGWTAFMVASSKGCVQCLRCLFDISLPVELEHSGVDTGSIGSNEDNSSVSKSALITFKHHNSCVVFQYSSDIEWSRPYVYNEHGSGRKSVLNFVIRNGLERCATCFLLGDLDVPHFEVFHNFHDGVDVDHLTLYVFDYQGNSALILASLGGHRECLEYLLQIERVRLHVLVLLLKEEFLRSNTISLLLYKKLCYLIQNSRQVDYFLNLMCHQCHLGSCVDFLLSAFVCHYNHDGHNAVSYALRNEHYDCLRLLVEHMTDIHKISLHMKNLFLTAANKLPTLAYVPIFVKGGIFHWSWYPLFPHRKLRFLARELVIHGYPAGQFEWQRRQSSPLNHAFTIIDIGLVRYLLANLYLTSHDVEHFQRDMDLHNFVSHRGSEEIQCLHRQLCVTPWRLESLSLLTVSTLLRGRSREQDTEKSILAGLPDDIKLRLEFMKPLRWLCVRQWIQITDLFLLGRQQMGGANDARDFSQGRCCNGACFRITR